MRHTRPTPRSRRRVLFVALLVAVVVPSVAGAQGDPAATPTSSTVAPSTSVVAVPSTEPPVSEPTTTQPATTPPTPTTVAPGADTEPPPMSDGSEIPEPSDAVSGDAERSPEASGASGSSQPLDTAAVRAAVVQRLAASADPVAAARQIEAEALAELARSDQELAAARRAHDQADQRRREAQVAASDAAARANDAREESAAAAGELRDLAVAAYLDPPAELAVAAALSGRTDERLAAEGMVAAQADVAERALRRAARTERTARTAAAGAEAAAAEATDAAVVTEERLTALERDVAQRAEVLARITTVAQTLWAQAAGGLQLADLVSIEQVTTSGSVVVTVNADGTWSIVPVGFPAQADIVRIPGTTISVHRLIAGPVQAMVVAAAVDGVHLDGWGYRSSVRQVELRRSHCGSSLAVVVDAPASSCRPPTARPGRSMHERGLAVDFANCSTRSTPCYTWLSANAARFGLLNLPSEPWHWSTNGN